MTNNKRIAAQVTGLLKRSGLAPVDVVKLGKWIHVDFLGQSSARKAELIMAQSGFSTKLIESRRENKINTNTVLRPSMHTVWHLACWV